MKFENWTKLLTDSAEQTVKNSVRRLDTKGYPEFYSCEFGWILAHRFVAFAKFGPALFDYKIQVRHKDHNKENYHADNLCLGTLAQNGADNRTNPNVKKW